MNISVTKAEPKDAEFIIHSQIAMAMDSEKLTLNLATVTQGVNHVFTQSHVGEYYLAIDETGAPCACLLVQKEWSDWRNGTVLWIHSVYVKPEFRKLGIFATMYQHLKERVQTEPNLRGLRLYVDQTNMRAIAAYERIGMSREHYHLYEWMK